jgi:excisionase family DNA binding protein
MNTLRIVTPDGTTERLQVSIAEAALMLDYSDRTIRRLIAAGELEAVGKGGLRRVTVVSIEAYQQRHSSRKGAA